MKKNCKHCHETEESERECHYEGIIAGQLFIEARLFSSLFICLHSEDSIARETPGWLGTAGNGIFS